MAGNEWKTLFLLMYKNFIVFKRNWAVTLAELTVPGFFFLIFMGLRTLFVSEIISIDTNTIHPILNTSYLENNFPPHTLRLMYMPDNKFTSKIMENASNCLGIPYHQLFGFDWETDMLQHYERLQSQDINTSVLAVVFENTEGESVPVNLRYTIKTSYAIGSSLIDSNYAAPSHFSDTLIEYVPFVALQTCVDDLFISQVASNYTPKETVTRVIQKTPYPPYETTAKSEAFFRNTVIYWAPTMFIITILMVPSYITTEKDTGVNALLKLNGVKTYQNFLGWLIGSIPLGAIAAAPIVVVLKIRFTAEQLPYFYYSNGFILWLAILTNFIHTYAFSLHVSSYFTKARLAQVAMVVMTYAVRQVMNQLMSNKLHSVLPYLGFIFPNVACTRIFEEFNSFDNIMVGVQWNNIFTTNHEVLGFDGTLGFIMIFGILTSILHFFLALYINAVLPSKYSVQESPLFFLKYFRRNRENNNNYDDDNEADDFNGQPQVFEPVAAGVSTPGIQIRKLKKSFTVGYCKQRTIKAVRGISLDFYKGEITALLGQNGAGKTTTISILTGLTAPTSGTVLVNGKSVSDNIQAIRNNLGVCPQENMTFPDLTVAEQLMLFGFLKQKKRTRQQVKADVEDILVKLKMTSKRNTLPKNLSGGQKRRLCLGMALVGDASTLILDEPTSGMDPETSRVTWEVILKFRKQKTIIITTHSMEEADVLGDRIAIMHNGKMKCYGSPMFLKKCYGKNNQEVTLSIEPWCDPAKIGAIVGPQAKIDTSTYGRLVVNVPLTDSLPQNLDKIENSKAKLGITGMSVSTITLEEVFLMTIKEEEREENSKVPNGDMSKKHLDVKSYTKLVGSKLTKQMTYALMAKKLSYALNNWGVHVAIIFGTLGSVILIPILKLEMRSKSTNYRSLSLLQYPDSEALVSGENGTLVDAYKDVIKSQGGAVTQLETKVNIIDALLERVATAGIVYYSDNIVVSAEFDSSGQTLIANGLYSGSGLLSAPITVNTMSNSLLKTFAGSEYSIDASIENLPVSFLDYVYNEISMKSDNLMEMMTFVSVYFIILGLFVINPLLEANTTVKQLQRMTGVSAFLYWGTMFIFDFGVYILTTIVIVVGFVVMNFIFQLDMYHMREVGILSLILLLFGGNILLMAYTLSFSKKPLFMVLIVLSLATTLVAQIEVIVDLALHYLTTYDSAFIIQRRILSVLPQVSFMFGYTKFLEIARNNARCRKLPNNFAKITCFIGDPCCGLGCKDGSCKSSFPYLGDFSEDAGLEEFLLYLTLTPIIFLVILFVQENRTFEILASKLRPSKRESLVYTEPTDADVANEKLIVRRVNDQYEQGLDHDDKNVFLAYELRKWYGKLEAVKGISFRVKKNECFGLLGVNGAGKSTTFRMLVGEEIPTSGILHRGTKSIKFDRIKYLAGIGYCPQMNALIPSFNAYEHLTLFARLRGIPELEVASHVQFWIDNLGLSKHAKNLSKRYSGGNKRRLNIAMALIGNPELVLLDEPTAGVDPEARRSLWNVLQSCQASGQAIILTSHSMEECEALCNRLLIMAKGQMICIGASQQLKQAYGAGYDITIKLDPERSVEEFEQIKEKIQANFICEIRDEHSGYLYYHVTDPHITWVQMFDTMNTIKSQHSCIEDFTVSSSTLEQLFIQFARSTSDSIFTAPET